MKNRSLSLSKILFNQPNKKIMANNRLYIGNIETGKTYCISKAGDNSWKPISKIEDIDGLNDILLSDEIWAEKSNLVLFSESDNEMFNFFFKKSK